MKKLIILLTITFFSFNISIGQTNWEFLGTMDWADVWKVVKDGTRYFAITDNGIYDLEGNSENWTFLAGTQKLTGYDVIFIKDFYVSNGIFYVIYSDDTGHDFVRMSEDFGKNWTTIRYYFRDFDDFKVKGDTIQIRGGNNILYSYNNLKTVEYLLVHVDIPLYNDIDIFDLRYVVSHNTLYNLKRVEDSITLDTNILELPTEYDFVQLIHADSFVFVWMKDSIESILFKINPKTKSITESLKFKHNKQLRTPIDRFYYGNYFKYENNALSLVSNKLFNTNKVFTSFDWANTWDTLSTYPEAYIEMLDSTWIINSDNQLLFGTNLGKKIINRSQGILSVQDIQLRRESIDWMVEIGKKDNSRYYVRDSERLMFFEWPHLRNYQWVASKATNVYGVKDGKFCQWDALKNNWECAYSVNDRSFVKNIFITNGLLFIAANDGLKYSHNEGVSWNEISEDTTLASVIFHQGRYFLFQGHKVISSEDLIEWTPIDFQPFFFGGNSDFLSYFFGLYSTGNWRSLLYKYNEDLKIFESLGKLPLTNNRRNNGFIAIDSSCFLTFTKDRGINITKNKGQTWETLDDFNDTKIFDIKVIEDEIYVLNMLGLWKRSMDFLTTSSTSDITKNTSFIQLSPNPTSSTFSVDFSQPTEIQSIKIMDIKGQVIYTQYHSYNSIDISSFATGVYFVVIETNEGREVKRIVKGE